MERYITHPSSPQQQCNHLSIMQSGFLHTHIYTTARLAYSLSVGMMPLLLSMGIMPLLHPVTCPAFVTLSVLLCIGPQIVGFVPPLTHCPRAPRDPVLAPALHANMAVLARQKPTVALVPGEASHPTAPSDTGLRGVPVPAGSRSLIALLRELGFCDAANT